MKNQLFKTEQFDRMASEVRRVLSEIGYAVDHPQVKALAIKSGCRESVAGRILFSDSQINGLREELLRQYPCSGHASQLIHPKGELKVNIGNLTPKFY